MSTKIDYSLLKYIITQQRSNYASNNNFQTYLNDQIFDSIHNKLNKTIRLYKKKLIFTFQLSMKKMEYMIKKMLPMK